MTSFSSNPSSPPLTVRLVATAAAFGAASLALVGLAILAPFAMVGGLLLIPISAARDTYEHVVEKLDK